MKRIMRKAVILLIVLCMAAGSVMVHAENFDVKDTIAFGQTRIVTVPKPEGEIDPGFVYFNQEFTFVPEEDGTYRFLVSYQEDEAKPYDIFMDVVGAYRELENEGYLVTLPGKGTFAAEDQSVEGKRIDVLWQQLERAADELRFAGVSTQQLIAHLQKGADHD